MVSVSLAPGPSDHPLPACPIPSGPAPSPVEAPRASALTTCPTVWMPPSAMTGTPKRRAYSATLYTAVPWGRPQAITGDGTRDRCQQQWGPITGPSLLVPNLHLEKRTALDIHVANKNNNSTRVNVILGTWTSSPTRALWVHQQLHQY